MVTASQKKATKKYQDKTYDKILIRLQKGNKNILNAAAAAENKSLNKYISDIIVNYCKDNNIQLIQKKNNYTF